MKKPKHDEPFKYEGQFYLHSQTNLSEYLVPLIASSDVIDYLAGKDRVFENPRAVFERLTSTPDKNGLYLYRLNVKKSRELNK